MNKFFISLIFLLFSSVIYSQDIGFHLGGTSSNLLYKSYGENVSDKLDFQNVYGLNFGANLNMNLVQSIYLSTGLDFYQNGYRSDEFKEENSISLAREAKMNYLRLPVKFVLEPRNAVLKPSLRLGGYFSYLLGGDFDVKNYSRPVSIDDEFEKLDAGIILGAGLSLNNFTLELSYDLGLMNIFQRDNSAYSPGEQIMKNRSLNLNLIYWL